jgi:hypothetical protein
MYIFVLPSSTVDVIIESCGKLVLNNELETVQKETILSAGTENTVICWSGFDRATCFEEANDVYLYIKCLYEVEEFRFHVLCVLSAVHEASWYSFRSL